MALDVWVKGRRNEGIGRAGANFIMVAVGLANMLEDNITGEDLYKHLHPLTVAVSHHCCCRRNMHLTLKLKIFYTLAMVM